MFLILSCFAIRVISIGVSIAVLGIVFDVASDAAVLISSVSISISIAGIVLVVVPGAAALTYESINQFLSPFLLH